MNANFSHKILYILMDILWYFSYEEELQTLHPEGSSVCLDFAEGAVTSPQSYCTVKNAVVAELNFINFTV